MPASFEFCNAFLSHLGQMNYIICQLRTLSCHLSESIESVEKGLQKMAARRQLNTLRLSPKVQNHQWQQEKRMATCAI